MSQLTDNLSAIASIKSDIRAAIESKGVSMAGVSFWSYADKIGEITTSFVTEPLTVTNNGTYTPSQGVDGYSQVTVNVPQSVTGFTEKNITEGVQIVNLSNNASRVAKCVYAFNGYIETVYLPDCKFIGSCAFSACSNLQSVVLPNCVSVGLYGGNYVSDNMVFADCNRLNYISLPSCEVIGGSCFRYCYNLQSLDLPVCKVLDNNAFIYCSSLSYVSIPNCSRIGNSCFRECRNLKDLYSPDAITVGSAFISGCSSISQVSLPIVNNIGNSAFMGCSSLISLTLCTDVYWTIPYQAQMLSRTPIMSGTGSIYVRSETYNTWITSTGWSSLSNRFVSLSLSGPILSFSNGLLSGLTRCMQAGFSSYLGINANTVTTANLPECEYVQISAFMGCSSLSEVTLPVCKFIGEYAFYSNTVNLSITLGYSGIVQINNNNVFSTSVSIYVPSSLVDQYKSARFWSAYSSKIFPITE